MLHSTIGQALLALVLVVQPFGAEAAVQSISWSALRPADQPGRALEIPSAGGSKSATDGLVWRNEEQAIELTGFVLPIDQDGDLVYEFMLVPWAGACSHSASPPPNQLVHVFPKEPFHISAIYQPVRITGSLQARLDKAQLFIMDGTRVMTYGYSMRHASVDKISRLHDPDVRALPPGSFLSR